MVPWTPTGKEKQVARALGIKIEALPGWLEERGRAYTLRELAALISGHGVSVTHEWVRQAFLKFGLSVTVTPSREAAV